MAEKANALFVRLARIVSGTTGDFRSMRTFLAGIALLAVGCHAAASSEGRQAEPAPGAERATRGTALAEPLDLVAALDEAERAAQKSPESLEALFNRALARQRLFLPLLSAEAWVQYLARDSRSGRAAEAEAALAARRAPSEEELWMAAREHLRGAAIRGDHREVAAVVSRFPQAARTLGEEEALQAWAQDPGSHRNEPGKMDLTVAREIGRSLASFSGELMLRDSVQAIDQAQAGDAARLQTIREGLHAYREGLAAVKARRFSQAEAPLEQARRALARSDFPFAGWASFLLLRCAYQRSDLTSAERLARGLLAGLHESRYPVLAARTHWVLGTIEMALARPAEALADYRSALARFERTREAGNIDAVHSLLASADQELGDSRAAWQERFLALRGLSRSDPSRLRLVFTDSSFAALEEGFGEAAVTLQTEALHLAGRETLPLATGRLNRAAILVGIGQPERALPDLTAAERHTGRIEDAGVRESVMADLLLVRGQALAASHPDEALEALSRAQSIYQGGRRNLLSAQALLERARVLLRLGRKPEAEDDLRQAIEMLEEERGTVSTIEHRAALLARRGSVFDEMIDLLAKEGRVDLALDVAERSRARVLLDWLAALPGTAGGPGLPAVLPEPARSLRRKLPPGIAVICYSILQDRLLLWVVHRDSIVLRSVTIAPAWLRQTASRFVARGAATDGHRLYEALVRPAAADLADGETVVFVPEGALSALPFGALFNGASKRYLIEERPIAVAPSLNALIRLSAGTVARDLAGSDLLLVADPAFDRSLFPALPRLPAAAAEGREIAGLLRRVDVVAGTAATRSALLSGLGRHRILQFSGHAVVNPRNPLLSGLVLAPEAGGDSGFLYARDLLGLSPGVTELVILASCRSGVGAAAPGEGIAGLVWPLLSRGIPMVIASLRPVEDRDTARLFRAFYRHLSTGETPVNALRAAQLEGLAATGRSQSEALRQITFQLYGGIPASGGLP